LQSNTFSGLFEGQNVITLHRIPSTNEYLKEALSKSTPLPEGTVIMAVAQHDVRRQKASEWQSELGKKLTISLLLTPTFLDPKQQFALTVSISLAIAQWVESLTQTTATIEWPNDIYIGDRKIGGILIENVLKGKTWKFAVVGIGINVNQTEFPPTIRKQATSVKQILHRDYQVSDLLAYLCMHIYREYVCF